MQYARIVTLALETPWALRPETAQLMATILARRMAGDRLASDESRDQVDEITNRRAAMLAAAQQQAVTAGSTVAILPVFGVMLQRAGMMDEMSGAVSVESIGQRFRAAMADQSVGSIVLQVDSPGGSVFGVDELATEIYRARGQKPIIAVADAQAASAAYWLATAADELAVTPSGEVGSIGVYALHQDISRALDAAGVTPTLVSAGKYKVEEAPFAPLGEEARAHIQSRVDDYYTAFTRAVARGRAIPVDRVRSGFGQGRMLGAQSAVDEGMADRVATMGEVIDDLASGRWQRRKRRAERSASAEIELRRRRLALVGG